ncbi:metal ABC transporter substrate-binding protein [Paenibacillus sp. y28]|uniref:metal ABC transporter substrate-binding protein n=1 Tax=Paenibacillus sp. y28 TaxID=3129110 RepID=UPI0030158FF2
MNTWLKTCFAVVLASSFALAGCGKQEVPAAQTPQSSPASEVKPTVVASFYPLYEFARNVAGDKATVVNLVPAGVEPHDWEPTAKDMKQIQEANVFVYNGAGMEHWVEKTLSSVKQDKRIVVEASKGLELMAGAGHSHEHGDEDDHDHEHEKDGSHTNEKADASEAGKADDHDHAKEADGHGHEEESMDPHVWLDPVLAQKQVQAIQAALEQADPANKAAYKTNADAYIAKLQALDKEFKEGLAGAKRKEFVTQHTAFGYLAKRYSLTQVPIAGLSPEQEPTPAKMADIVKFAKEHQVKTIFFETLAAPKVAETVAKEIGAKSAVLNPIEGLTDEDKSKNLDYIGIMRNNLQALKAALNE